MSFGKNLQYLRQLSKNMTQEALAEKNRKPPDNLKMGNGCSKSGNGQGTGNMQDI